MHKHEGVLCICNLNQASHFSPSFHHHQKKMSKEVSDEEKNDALRQAWYPPFGAFERGEETKFMIPSLEGDDWVTIDLIGPQFPEIERWGHGECPYITAPFHAVKAAMLHGGELAPFAYPERALANLIGAAWRDGAWKRVLVVCADAQSCSSLIAMLKKVLMWMRMAIPRAKDGECVAFPGGWNLTTTTPEEIRAHGRPYDHLVFLMTDQIKELPAPRGETYVMSLDYGESYERRQAVRRSEGPLQADLKMIVVDAAGSGATLSDAA